MSKSNKDFFDEIKPWSILKNNILWKYLKPYLQKVLTIWWKNIYLIDAFSWKWKFSDWSNWSPLIMLDIAEECLSQSRYDTKNRVKFIFNDLNHSIELKNTIDNYFNEKWFNYISKENDIVIMWENFIKISDNIKQIAEKNIVFLYLDPFWIKDLPFWLMQEIIYSNDISIEILMNFNTWWFLRNACKWYLENHLPSYSYFEDNSDENLDVEDYSNNETLTSVAGWDYWIDIVKDYYKERWPNIKASSNLWYKLESSFCDLYKKNLLKNNVFDYIVHIPIKEKQDDLIKYRLFYWTNHTDWISLMGNTMSKQYKDIEISSWWGLFFDLPDFNKFHQDNLKHIIIKVFEKNEYVPYNKLVWLIYNVLWVLFSVKEINGIINWYLDNWLFSKSLQLTPTWRHQGSFDNDTFFWKRSIKYIERKSLLYKSEVEYWNRTINHIQWCYHWCNFPCYAMMMAKRFGKIKSYEDWRKIEIVSNIDELLDKEIEKYKSEIDFVHLCFMTDPFMYDTQTNKVVPEVLESTLKVIKKLNDNWIKVTTLTKWLYTDELIYWNYSKENEYWITLVSLNTKFHNKYEPYSSEYWERIKSLKKLSDAWYKTWVSIEPYPTPLLDDKQDLDKLLKKIKFVNKIIFWKLNYNSENSSFENYKEFYNESAQIVIDFCNKHWIEYHIKEWTQKKYNKETEWIFK